jgi:coproporphyrinogen III oxidase
VSSAPAASSKLAPQVQAFVETLQDEICAGLEGVEGRGGARFREDRWERPGGGGGRTRVLENGTVFEKAGVNTSAVHGELSEAFAGRLPGEGRTFFATGISLVLHPRNPFVPTVHANFRYLEKGGKGWFGGGSDLTPYYLFDEDAQHFHRTLKAACDSYRPDAYDSFKATCDRYFLIRHRNETRGVGGIFFDELGDDLDKTFAFVQTCGRAFLPSYLPIVERRRAHPSTDANREWQEIRRGRYVEFNLVYDRGTTFGLETQGRTESILMSLPPRVRWVYDHQPAADSEEARLVEVLRAPRSWI